MRGHSMKLGRGTLMGTSQYVGQGSDHLDIRAMNSMNSQYDTSAVVGTRNMVQTRHVKLGHSDSCLTGRVSLQFCCYIMIAIIALAPEATDILIVPLSIITFICFYLKCCRLNGRH